MKKYVIGAIILLALGLVFILFPGNKNYTNSERTSSNDFEYYYSNDDSEEDSLLPNDLNSILNENQAVPLDTIPGSTTVLVNRDYLLPSSYIPDQLVEPDIRFNFDYSSDKRKLQKVAADALEQLCKDAEKEKLIFYGVSGYRSYARQNQIYSNNISTRGREATDTVSAKPGSSEHQTGLAMDISAKSVGCRLDQSLGKTAEGKWLAKNCHKYGFIIRYPEGKDDITGYTYEPWHIRYVGTSVATYLFTNKLTLEEYYGCISSVTTEDDYTSGVDVEDADNVKYNTPTPKPKKTPKPTKKPKKTAKPTKKPKKTAKPTKTPTKTPDKTSAPTHKPTPTPTPVQPVESPVTPSEAPSDDDQSQQVPNS